MSYALGSQVDIWTDALASGLTVLWRVELASTGAVVDGGTATEIALSGRTNPRYYAQTAAVETAGEYVFRFWDSAGSLDDAESAQFTVGVEADALNYDRLAEQAPGGGPVVPVPGADPAQITIYVYAVDETGAKTGGVDFYLRLLESDDGLSHSTKEMKATSQDETGTLGLVTFTAPEGADKKWEVKRGRSGTPVTFSGVVKANDPLAMPGVMGLAK